MACHDPIADMLTKIRNAIMAKHESVSFFISNEKLEIIKILKNEGYIKNFKKLSEESKNQVKLFLKYNDKNEPAILGIQRISTPGRRIYKGCKDMPRIMNGMGTVIVSTSTGITTAKKAVERNVGGEILCYVW
ncbi:MAG: 30S ribosomal protein S8 [Spirochaetes bacterium GWF1_31_7]|nr:MAG: 30S ribosomal protein S8 [Spirochaetes bacterium GWE1_32_154]OHD47308.1 MAG: 30S ribosomal protein S8 [Spirochaetes bacterium GWE2_31_10]OHD47367.1 MAG: 30S ribosomal protein S8 [Spirochaetes bacterium GWF1_31_7]HBD92820.1 30S ribosomal protein S8 [Spirochaetia bacterium]HBI37327.1 30S ribosomal protein S8 [Spirochaetia bacterium]